MPPPPLAHRWQFSMAGWDECTRQWPSRATIGLRDVAMRSEEHTSELQSLMRISYAEFCVKKQKQVLNHNQPQLRYEKTKNDKSDHNNLNQTYEAELRRT